MNLRQRSSRRESQAAPAPPGCRSPHSIRRLALVVDGENPSGGAARLAVQLVRACGEGRIKVRLSAE